MRHRLYYLLPDVDSARKTFDDMLLARIDQSHVHFLSTGAPLPPDMPEATFLQRTDVVRGAKNGMLGGAALGILLGAVIVLYFDLTSEPAGALLVVAMTLIGVLFGGWAASMVAAAFPNSRLNAFYPELEKGKILMIADVPALRVQQIEKILAERHPETNFKGEEPNIPVFP